MKKLTLSLIAGLTFTSCTVDIPVNTGGGHGPVPMGGGYTPQYRGRPPIGAGQVIYHGSQARHVYGNGPQSYVGGFPPPGGYNPNYNYGTGGFCR